MEDTKFALSISDTGRILSVTYAEFALNDSVLVERLPDGNASDYLYIDGEYVFDPLPEVELPEPAPQLEDRVAELEAANEMLMECLLEMSELVYGG